MSNTVLVPSALKSHAAAQLIESITEAANTSYYLFVGDHDDHANNEVQTANGAIKSSVIDVYRNMVCGKRITSSDVLPMVRNISYTSNTYYDMYDDSDPLLSEKNFYAIVNASSYYHVYKCLDNNGNTRSTATPTFADISGSNSTLYQTSDGFRWKYLYSVSDTTKNKFATTEFFPIVANSTVTDAAVGGTIDIIKVEDGGARYDNYITGTLSASDIRINGNTTLYGISNSTASSVNGFYTGCLLYLSGGTGSGQYKEITDYFSNANGNFMVVNSAFTTAPVNGTEFEIYPTVRIVGDGTQTTNAVARALTNASSTNSVYRVEMLSRGAGYQYATATVVANSLVGVTENASVRPIYSPIGGHGSNIEDELFSTHATISVKLSNNESNTIPAINQIQQVGIIKDPIFVNTKFTLANTHGSFTSGERVYKFKPVRVATNATINTTSGKISSSLADFSNQFVAGERIYVMSSNGTSHQLSTINNVVNSTTLYLVSNGFFACTETFVYSPNVSATAFVSNIHSSSNITFSNVSGIFVSGDRLIGNNSGAESTINVVSRSGVTKGFDTFVQMHKYIGTYVSGTMTLNETVYQGNLATSNATLHSAVNVGGTITVYTSNQVGTFSNTGTMTGNTSGAVIQLSENYGPELAFGSGDVIYLENLSPITRSNTTSQTFKVLVEF